MKLSIRRTSWYLLTLLIATDLAFIFLGTIYECGFVSFADVCNTINFDSYFSLTRDRGYAEIFQYIKEYWLIILFGFLALNQSVKVYLGWLCLSAYMLLDDALEIHENLGSIIAQKLNFTSLFNLRPEDYGELLVFAIVGFTFFFWLNFSYKVGNKSDRNNSKRLIKVLLGLAFFGILIDSIHIIADKHAILKSILGIIEDGGEHIFMSLMVVVSWSILNSQQKKINYKASNNKSVMNDYLS